jgi:hypothetical protein
VVFFLPLLTKTNTKKPMDDPAKAIWEYLGVTLSTAAPLELVLEALRLYLEKLPPQSRRAFAKKFKRVLSRRKRTADRVIARSPFLSSVFGGARSYALNSHPDVRASGTLREVFASPPKKRNRAEDDGQPSDEEVGQPPRQRQRTEYLSEEDSRGWGAVILSAWAEAAMATVQNRILPVFPYEVSETPTAAAVAADVAESISDAAFNMRPTIETVLETVNDSQYVNWSPRALRNHLGLSSVNITGPEVVYYEPNPTSPIPLVQNGFWLNTTQWNIGTSAPVPEPSVLQQAQALSEGTTSALSENSTGAGLMVASSVALGVLFEAAEVYQRAAVRRNPQRARTVRNIANVAKFSLGVVGVGSAVALAVTAGPIPAAWAVGQSAAVGYVSGAPWRGLTNFILTRAWWKNINVLFTGIDGNAAKREVLWDLGDVWGREATELQHIIAEKVKEFYPRYNVNAHKIQYNYGGAAEWKDDIADEGRTVASLRRVLINIRVVDEKGRLLRLESEKTPTKTATIYFQSSGSDDQKSEILFEELEELKAKIVERVTVLYNVRPGQKVHIRQFAKPDDFSLDDLKDEDMQYGIHLQVYVAKRGTPDIAIPFRNEIQKTSTAHTTFWGIDGAPVNVAIRYQVVSDLERKLQNEVERNYNYFPQYGDVVFFSVNGVAYENNLSNYKILTEDSDDDSGLAIRVWVKDRTGQVKGLAHRERDVFVAEIVRELAELKNIPEYRVNNEMVLERVEEMDARRADAIERLEREKEKELERVKTEAELAVAKELREQKRADDQSAKSAAEVRKLDTDISILKEKLKELEEQNRLASNQNRLRPQPDAARGRGRAASAAAALSAVGSGPDEIEAAARLLLSSGMFF